jgi:hypothetical protein
MMELTGIFVNLEIRGLFSELEGENKVIGKL